MKQETKTHSEQLAHDLATGTHYQLRTEFRGDCESIVMVLKPWLVDWSECDGWNTNEEIKDPAKMKWVSRNWGGDTDVKFVLKAGGPSLNDIRWLINSIQDCHVAAQTVEPLDSYTGERMDYERFDEIVTRPSKEVMEAAMASITRLQEVHEIRMERTSETLQTLEAHIGNPEPYMHKVALRQATLAVKHGLVKGDIDCTKLAEVFYQNMTFDSSGTHIRFPGI